MSDGDRDEPGLGRKIAATGAEIAGTVAKDAAGQAVGAAFSFGYLIVLTGASIVVLVGALAVYLVGWAGSTLLLSNVPEVRGFIAPFWGIVALVLLFIGIRWVVRRVGRPIERSAEQAVESIHLAIDGRVAGVRGSEAVPASSATGMPAPAPAPRLTLAELDARLAPPPIPPDEGV